MNAHFVGMVHLAALPGTPLSTLTIYQVIERARVDALTLQEGGVDAVIVENFNDVPFRSGQVDRHTIAMMTRACQAIREELELEVGVNVLRNDGSGAIAIAAASGCNFIRVNIHTGTMVTDQGIISGQADETLRLRRLLGVEQVKIFADVFVKHASPLGNLNMEDVIGDLIFRGLADGVIVSGTATGKSANPNDIQEAVRVAGQAPVYVGSGINAENVEEYVPPASGIIVGSSLKRDGIVSEPVDVDRVRLLRRRLNAVT